MPVSFQQLMTARFLFTLASQIQAVILGWSMYELTKDPLYLGLVGLAEALPAIGMALYAGYAVDHGKPLVIFRGLLVVSLISAAIMLFGAGHSVAALFASSALTGVARAFSQPSVFALVPRIVARGQLSRSSAWMATSMQVARISGPAAGGILFGWIGVSGASVVVCTVLSMALATSLLIKPPADVRARAPRRSVREELLSGAVFVIRHPILFPAMTLDMVSVFFGGVTALLPIYAAEILRVGPMGLGILRAAPAVGATLMSLWLTSFEIRRRAGTWLFAAVTGFGLCMLVFALSRSFALSLAALALGGAFDSVSMVVRTAAVQLSSPDAMRGRISAVNSIFIGSSNELGEFESGVLARLMGTVPSAVFGAVACLATVAVVGALAPKLRRLDLDQMG